jgi:hypothetical protein
LGEGLNFVSAHHHGSVAEVAPGGEAEVTREAHSDAKPASNVQPFILFGSSFPKDKEYTQVIIPRELSCGHRVVDIK